MTIYQLHFAFTVGLDKSASFATPEFSIQEIDHYINLGCEAFVKSRYSGNNIYQTGVDESQKNIDEISFLIKNKTLPFISEGQWSNREKNIKTAIFKTPDDIWYTLSERVVGKRYPCPKYTNRINCGELEKIENPLEKHEAIVFKRSHNEINLILNDPFNKPKKDRVLRLQAEGHYEVFYDSIYWESVSEYYINYLAQFEKLQFGLNYNLTNWETLNFWFPINTHQQIVNYAIQFALESIEQPRQQSFINTLTKNE
jgi:hypothetical protein